MRPGHAALSGQPGSPATGRARGPRRRTGGPPGRIGYSAADGGGGGGAVLLSFSFAGRFGRLDYFSASLLSSVIAFVLIWLAVVTGVNGLAGLGMLLSFIHALRCVALRLHDTGRTGWLEGNGLYATVYRVDSDRQVAERLQSIIGGNARIQLPALEVNGKALPGNPDVRDVHDHLRLASD